MNKIRDAGNAVAVLGSVKSVSCDIIPTTASIGDTVEITGKFKNTSWFFAFGVLQVLFDGQKIYEEDYLLIPLELGVLTIEHTIPDGTNSGNHEYAVKEKEESLESRKTAILTIAFNPPPNKCNLVVKTIPAGADVYINDAYRGTSPLQLEVDEGYYDVSVSLEGYEDATDRVYATAGQICEVEFDLIGGFKIPWKTVSIVAGGLLGMGAAYYIIKPHASVIKSKAVPAIKKAIASRR